MVRSGAENVALGTLRPVASTVLRLALIEDLNPFHTPARHTQIIILGRVSLEVRGSCVVSDPASRVPFQPGCGGARILCRARVQNMAGTGTQEGLSGEASSSCVGPWC